MKFRITVFAIILGWVLLLSSCRDRYFLDRSAAVKYLDAQHQGFEQVAEAWSAGVPQHPSIFCNFGPSGYRWGKTFIRTVSGGFTMENDGRKGKAATLEEASSWAGAPYVSVSHWVNATSQYKIYCIQDSLESNVQIMLAGSEWSPYGFRYAPKNNDSGLKSLIFYAGQGGIDSSDRRMELISGRWFYFEAKR